jgi:hypothetical protein
MDFTLNVDELFMLLRAYRKMPSSVEKVEFKTFLLKKGVKEEAL